MKLRDQFLQPGFQLPGSQGSARRLRFRTIWISDVHLGTTGCQAARLLEFCVPPIPKRSTWSATSSTAGS